MTAITTTESRTIGPVTTAASGGATAAGAVAVLIVWGLTAAGVDVPAEASAAIATLCAALGGLAGGWLAPSQAGKTAAAVADVVPSAQDVAQAVAQVTPSKGDVQAAIAGAIPEPATAEEVASAAADKLLDPTSGLHQQVATVAAVTAREAVSALTTSTPAAGTTEDTTEDVETPDAATVEASVDAPSPEAAEYDPAH